jgi:hypothetical protein
MRAHYRPRVPEKSIAVHGSITYTDCRLAGYPNRKAAKNAIRTKPKYRDGEHYRAYRCDPADEYHTGETGCGLFHVLWIAPIVVAGGLTQREWLGLDGDIDYRTRFGDVEQTARRYGAGKFAWSRRADGTWVVDARFYKEPVTGEGPSIEAAGAALLDAIDDLADEHVIPSDLLGEAA